MSSVQVPNNLFKIRDSRYSPELTPATFMWIRGKIVYFVNAILHDLICKISDPYRLIGTFVRCNMHMFYCCCS